MQTGVARSEGYRDLSRVADRVSATRLRDREAWRHLEATFVQLRRPAMATHFFVNPETSTTGALSESKHTVNNDAQSPTLLAQ
jgi:hypothetical protein